MSVPNVLLVVLDSVRARNTSLYGYGNRTTPYLERLATESHVYEQARAPSIHSVSSHASLFTGLHVPEHGVTAHESELAPESTIWHELATDHGYETGLFSPNVVVTLSSNLAEPFDTIEGPRGDVSYRLFENALSPMDVEGHQTNLEYLSRCFRSGAPIRSILNGLYFVRGGSGGVDADETAPVYIDSFLEWSGSVDGPWAACLNLMDAHYPYLPAPEFDNWGSDELRAIHERLESPQSKSITVSDDWWKLRGFESLYDGGIRQVDAALESLVDGLRERGELDETLVVVTSDHGEGFGEWSRINPKARMVDHSWGIHEVLTHVPLLVRPPGGEDNRRTAELASLTQFPTVVRDVIDGAEPNFAVEEYALAATYRLEAPEKVLPSSVTNRDAYVGPWFAVYESAGDVVLKHATQGSNALSLEIPDAHSAVVRDHPERELVEEVYSNLESANVRVEQREGESITGDIERQLEDLGYLR